MPWVGGVSDPGAEGESDGIHPAGKQGACKKLYC